MDSITITLSRDKDTTNSARFRGEEDGVQATAYVPLADAPEGDIQAELSA